MSAFAVRIPDWDEDWRPVTAFDHAAAAEEFAETAHDESAGEIFSAAPPWTVEVEVRKGDDEAPRVFVVTMEHEPSFYAHEKPAAAAGGQPT